MERFRVLRELARSRLPAAVFDYVDGGAGDERSLAEAETAWDHWWLVPRHLTGVATPDLSVSLLGSTLAAPLVLAPTAAHRMLHPDGELATARAAARAGIGCCLSTRATTDLAEVARAADDVRAGSVRWFQLYVGQDRSPVTRVLGRLAGHGYTHVVLTVDLPVGGRRERERRHADVPLPPGVSVTTHLGADTGTGPDRQREPLTATKPPVGGWGVLTWADVGWVREASGLPVLVKGVLSGTDAERAVQAGAAGVIVSTHGARQLDGVVPSAFALPEVVATVAGRVPVLVDGGIRDGGDWARALALGAQAVLIGRPYLWGLCTDGEYGVSEVIDALVGDLARTMTLLGAATVTELGPHHLRPRTHLPGVGGG